MGMLVLHEYLNLLIFASLGASYACFRIGSLVGESELENYLLYRLGTYGFPIVGYSLVGAGLTLVAAKLYLLQGLGG